MPPFAGWCAGCGAAWSGFAEVVAELVGEVGPAPVVWLGAGPRQAGARSILFAIDAYA
jgi:hypothetical protein